MSKNNKTPQVERAQIGSTVFIWWGFWKEYKNNVTVSHINRKAIY